MTNYKLYFETNVRVSLPCEGKGVSNGMTVPICRYWTPIYRCKTSDRKVNIDDLKQAPCSVSLLKKQDRRYIKSRETSYNTVKY